MKAAFPKRHLFNDIQQPSLDGVDGILSFGGEVMYRQHFDSSQCNSPDPDGIGGQDAEGCLADEMQRRGHAAKVTSSYGGNRNAVLVEVPERGMSLLFVKKEMCREFTSPR